MANPIEGNLNITGIVQLRGDTAANLASRNPTLALREIMIETDTGKFKIGTGDRYICRWNNLDYAGGMSETWTFELEDGSSYTRDVALWT